MPLDKLPHLNTVLKDSLIKEVPDTVALLNTDLVFLNSSSLFIKELRINKQHIFGLSIKEVLPFLPTKLYRDLDTGIKGKICKNEGERCQGLDRANAWYKWKIIPWWNANGNIGGVILVIEDITDKKREENLYLSALKVAKIGGWEIDFIANDVYWTQITKEIHETPKDFIPDLKKAITFYKEGYSRNKIKSLIETTIKKGGSWDVELQLVTYTKKELWVRIKGEAEMKDGKCIRIFGTFQNIDKAKKIDLAYKKVSERLKIAKKAAKIGIWEYDIHNNSLVWDHTMHELYGIKKANFSGTYEAWKSTIHPNDQEGWQKEINQAIAGHKNFNTNFRVVWPNGEIRHITTASVIKKSTDGSSETMIGANWDITELMDAKLRLIRSEESFQGAFQNSDVGMAIIGLDGKWIDANEIICENLGYSKKEFLSLPFQEMTHPEDYEKDWDVFSEVLEGKRSSCTMEKRYFHAKGHILHAIVTVTGVKEIDDNLVHYICQVIDISNKINTELKLKKILKITRNQNKKLLSFAHIVSHNLRSHSSNLTMLSNFLIEEKDKQEKQIIEKFIRDSSKSLNETVSHLNEVIHLKKIDLKNLKPISLYEAILQVKNNINGLLEQHRVKCSLNISKEIKIKGINAYIESILLNLFTNSIKYKHPNRYPFIEITSYIEGRYKVLCFKDNGVGIDLEKNKNKIFGMYKTFHNHPESKGLGLFITKNQIEAISGKITVESKVNEGTTFRLYFQKD